MSQINVAGGSSVYIRQNGSGVGTYSIVVRDGIGFSSITIVVTNPVIQRNMFANNAQVYYKRGSLPSCGVGSVRNYRKKAYKT